jgi:hypothetical protein
LRKAEPDGRDAAAIFTLEVKIISIAENQLGAREIECEDHFYRFLRLFGFGYYEFAPKKSRFLPDRFMASV